MIISINEMIQAGIYVMAAAFCLLSILVLVYTGVNTITKSIVKMFIFEALLLISDACTYMFNGNTDTISIYISRVSNFMVFITEIIIALVGFVLTIRILEMCGVKVKRIYWHIAYVNAAISALLVVVNLFTHFMYYFDENNLYYRNWGWYVFSFFCSIILIDAVILSIKSRKELYQELFIAIMFYAASPIVLTIIQLFVFGFSLINFATIISVVVILWANASVIAKIKGIQTEDYKKSKMALIALLLLLTLVACMSSSIVTCIMSIQRISDENTKDNQEAIYKTVQTEVENYLLRPIVISSTIAENRMIKDAFLTETDPALVKDLARNEDVELISEYLKSINEAYGYQAVFAICDECKTYYTYNGILKYLDYENNSSDTWYRDFVETNRQYELNTDADELYPDRKMVYINTRVNDDNGNLIGVAGVGVPTSEIVQLISEYEKQYGIKVAFCNSEGMIKLSSNIDEIDNTQIDFDNFEEVEAGIIHHTAGNNTDTLATYVDTLGWYLIIDISSIPTTNEIKSIFPSLIIFGIGLVIMITVFWVLYNRGEHNYVRLLESQKLSRTDGLTGLSNRRAYMESKGDLERSGNYMSTAIIVMDINGLKTVNDTVGHDAGDELIIGAAECMSNAFGRYGEIFRTGGDEFIALLECNRQEIEVAIELFRNNMNSWEGASTNELSASVGFALASEYEGLTIPELEKLADKFMYANKNEYYRKTGKDRRMNW